MRIVEALRSVLRYERIETDPVARRLRRAASVEDLRRIAKRRLLTLPRSSGPE
jgi:L-lactate dehydrogenase (cytochrome)